MKLMHLILICLGFAGTNTYGTKKVSKYVSDDYDIQQYYVSQATQKIHLSYYAVAASLAVSATLFLIGGLVMLTQSPDNDGQNIGSAFIGASIAIPLITLVHLMHAHYATNRLVQRILDIVNRKPTEADCIFHDHQV